MNLNLDDLLQRAVRDATFRESARAAPQSAAREVGVSVDDLMAVIDGDLLRLHDRGAHPLWIMKLAGVLDIDPMARLGDSSVSGPAADFPRLPRAEYGEAHSKRVQDPASPGRTPSHRGAAARRARLPEHNNDRKSP